MSGLCDFKNSRPVGMQPAATEVVISILLIADHDRRVEFRRGPASVADHASRFAKPVRAESGREQAF